MNCPKCGRACDDGQVICPGCDYVLDTSFLGDDITLTPDDQAPGRQQANANSPKQARKRTRSKASHRQPTSPTHEFTGLSEFGADALILGDGVGDYDSFRANDTGLVQREVTNARIYVGGAVQELLRPDAIPSLVPGTDAQRLKVSPIEAHVLSLVNAYRPVGRIRRKSGLSKVDVTTALALLADKGLIQLAGFVDEERKARAREKRRKRRQQQRRARGQQSKQEGSQPPAAPPAGEASSAAPAPSSPPPSDALESSFQAAVAEIQSARQALGEPLSAQAPPPDVPFELPDRAPPAPVGDAIHDEQTFIKKIPNSEAPPPPDAALADAPGDGFDLLDAPTGTTNQHPDQPISLSSLDGDVEDVEDVEIAPPAVAPTNAPPPVDPRASLAFSGEESATLAQPGAALPGDAGHFDTLAASDLEDSDALAIAEDIDELADPAATPPPPQNDAAVSFEMRRKAAKIFEQAEKDHAEGRISSAIMNAKLALIYNPAEPRYQTLLAQWETDQKQRAPRKQRELVLFEAAKEEEARGNYAEAVRILHDALQLAPNAAALHNRLGVILATRLKKFDAASNALMRACELSPGNMAYNNNLGKVLAMAQQEVENKPKKRRLPWGKAEDESVIKVKKLRPKMF